MSHARALPRLTDAEDRLLALAEDEFVTARFARNILGVFYGRPVGVAEMRTLTGRLSALRLIRWRVRGKGIFQATGVRRPRKACVRRGRATRY